MSDNTIYMRDKENPKREKKEYGELVIRISSKDPNVRVSPKVQEGVRLKYLKPLVEKIEGAFNEKGELVKETKVGETYVFKVTKNKDSILSLIKQIYWAEQIDNGDICDLELNKENLYLNEDNQVCFKYKVPSEKPTRIYAYVAKPIKKVSVLINAEVKKETILIIGTEQHSANYGNKLMFPAQAVREVYSNYKEEEYLTVMLFTDGYNKEQKKQIKDSVLEHNPKANHIEINAVSDLIKYLNEGEKELNRLEPNSKGHIVKIGLIKIFAHGLPSIFDFGLDGANQSSQRFNISDVVKLKKESFKDADIYSYACRTGNVSYDEIFNEDWSAKAKPEESLAQKLADYLGVKVYGYIKRSNYASTWNDGGDESYKKDYEEIEDKSVTGRLYKPWDWDETLWHDNGAYKAPKNGSTPVGLPDKLYKFEKGKAPSPIDK